MLPKRMTLSASCLFPAAQFHVDSVPLLVTIRTSNRAPGSFEYRTNSTSLLQFLRGDSSLSGYVLKNFRLDLECSAKTRLAIVNFKDDELRQIGYFVD